MIENFIQNKPENNKWGIFSYESIVSKLTKDLLKPAEQYSSHTFISYSEQNTTFLITTENNDYVIYQFSTLSTNILGQGKYAIVYAGRNLKTGEEVAIKVSHDDSWIELSYSEIPPGWKLVKEKLKDYKYFPKIFHYGVDEKTIGTKKLKVYLVMEKLVLKPFYKTVKDTENIKDRVHLQTILDQLFDAVTVMHQHKIYGLDWTGDNVQLDAKGDPKLFDYDNWFQKDEDALPWVNEEANEEATKKVNYSYSRFIPIIGTYYAKFSIYSITMSIIDYHDQIADKKEIISKKEFFTITENIIKTAEEKLSGKQTEAVNESCVFKPQTP